MLNFCDNNLNPNRPLGGLLNNLGCFHHLSFTFRLLVGIMSALSSWRSPLGLQNKIGNMLNNT